MFLVALAKDVRPETFLLIVAQLNGDDVPWMAFVSKRQTR